MGATGRTGTRVLNQLLERGVEVRVIVRSSQRLPTEVFGDTNLSILEADLLALSDKALQDQLQSCDAVISCLGHTITFRGIFGPPLDLVTRAIANVCRNIEVLSPEKPVKVILMGSVSVNDPAGRGTFRKGFEKAVLWLLRLLVPPAKDNQTAADYLYEKVGTDNPFIQWVVVRPDTLKQGDVSEYKLHEDHVATLAKPAATNMANIGHFMGELLTYEETWQDWMGKLPVIVNAGSD